MRTLAICVGLAACYGDGEGFYLSETSFEPRAQCDDEHCSLAAGRQVTLTAEHYSSDTVSAAAIASATVDRADALEVTAANDTVVLHGIAAGRAVLRLEQPGYKGPIVLERTIDVVNPQSQFIASRYGRATEAPDGRLRILAGSRLTLSLERRGDDGAPLLGNNIDTWSTSSGAAAQLAPEGRTGVLQTLIAGDPEALTVTTSDVSTPIDVVPIDAVASLRVFVRERPELAATDGQTIRMPEAASYSFVVEAFDADGNVIEGAGRDFDVEGATTFVGAPLGRGFTVKPRDTTVRITIGPVTAVVKLDYP
jgi:hypothetical protein